MFRFKLQSVLEYRMNIEEKILHEYSNIRRCLEEQKDILKSLIAKRKILVSDLRNTPSAPIKADDIAEIVSYIDAIRLQEKEQKKNLQETKKRLDEKRLELMEAVKNRKVMENLRDKHAEEYQKSINLLEQKNADEMSMLKYGRREA